MLELANGVRVVGSVISTSDVIAGERCAITGVVVAERRVSLAHGCRVGSADRQVTVSAPEIHVSEGVVAHGTVWARSVGTVVKRTAV